MSAEVNMHKLGHRVQYHSSGISGQVTFSFVLSFINCEMYAIDENIKT